MCAFWRSTNSSPLQKPKVEGSKDDLFGEEAKQTRKRTEEGYAIYTEVGSSPSVGLEEICSCSCG